MLPPRRPYNRIAQVMGVTAKAARLMVERSTKDLPVTRTASLAPPVFDNFTVGVIRRRIHAMFEAKQVFTVGSLTADLKKAGIIPETTSDTSVWRLIHKMGFRYKTSQRKMYVNRVRGHCVPQD